MIDPLTSPLRPDLDDIQALRKEWLWFLILGIGLALVGIVAVSSAFVATMVSVILLGIILFAAGIAQTITAFWAPRSGGVVLHLLFGILYMVVGFMMIDRPISSAEALTILMAVFFIAGGVIRIVMSLQMRFRYWGWQLLNGVVTLLLGVIIWTQLPGAALWVIGLFIGIDLLFAGWFWIIFAWHVHALPADGESSGGV